MADVKPDLRTIFCAAIELESPAEVSQYLDEVCGDDDALRHDVPTLLKSHEERRKLPRRCERRCFIWRRST